MPVLVVHVWPCLSSEQVAEHERNLVNAVVDSLWYKMPEAAISLLIVSPEEQTFFKSITEIAGERWTERGGDMRLGFRPENKLLDRVGLGYAGKLYREIQEMGDLFDCGIIFAPGYSSMMISKAMHLRNKVALPRDRDDVLPERWSGFFVSEDGDLSKINPSNHRRNRRR